jgi:hypothetical protein
MAQKTTYTTIQGDTWDNIALAIYGAEKYADYLMENNLPYLDTLIFSAGTVLQTPAMPDEQSGDLPPWRSYTTDTNEDGVDPYDE